MSDDNRTVFSPRPTGVAPGTQLNGIYEIERLLAVGGMGEVYKGRAIETGDAVAIKMIRPDMAQNDAALALFRKEAAALHNLYNEAIVRYYVFTIDPVSRSPYLAMEFVDGQPLSERIKQTPLSLDEADLLRRRIAIGLHAAHELGITHRDVSPDNIILPGGSVARAKIIDFGIARSTQVGEGTVIGSGFAGKYNYVSPEQLGLQGGDVGGKSDIYSLGLVLAEALSGRPLDMGGTQVQILDKRRTVPDLGLIDARIRPLIATMLAPDPADRPADMAAVAAWQPSVAVTTPPPRKAPVVAIAASVVVLLALVGGGVLLAPRFLSPSEDGLVQRATSQPPGLSGPATEAPTSQANAPALPAAPALTEAPALATPPSAPAAIPAPQPQAAAPSQPAAPAVVPPAVPPVPQPSVPAARPAPAQQNATLPSAPALTEPAPKPAVATPQAPPAPTLSEPAPKPAVAAPQPPSPQAPAAPAVVASAQPPRPPAAGPGERIERYVASYDGGPCFFLWPTAIAAKQADLEGFGTGAEPFIAFDTAFQKANGFEAQIQLRPVTQAQCPVTTFLRQLEQRIDRGPRLQIGSFTMKSGEALNGSVEGFSGQNLDVLLIGDDGLVYNLASYLRREGEKATFALKLQSTGGTAKPQLVLALVSKTPLKTTSGANPAPADEFFPALAQEMKRNGEALGLGLKYFRLE